MKEKQPNDTAGDIVIRVRRDSSEMVTYDYDDFMAFSCCQNILSYQNSAATAHWHMDIEMVVALSGHMDYNVNGSVEHLKEGCGIIVNSRQMHFPFSKDGSGCDFISLRLHPMLLCVSHQVEDSVVTPFISDSSILYILLRENVPWEKKILLAIREIYSYRDNDFAALRIQSLFCQIWADIAESAAECRKYFSSRKNQDMKLVSLKNMISFIHNHYKEKITLEDIANEPRK